jgi:uncharacterized zinc-type alcohol dehydrogenase-like protein
VVISRDAAQMAAVANSFDFILNTVAASLDLGPYLKALKLNGAMVLVGAPAEPHQSPPVFDLIMGVLSDIEIIPMAGINGAYERMLKGDVKYRFVIDMKSLKDEVAAAA